MKKVLLSLTAVALLATACKKDNDDDKTPSENLVGSWKITAATANPAIDFNNDSIPETDIYAVVPTCVKDDITSFSADGTFAVSVEDTCEASEVDYSGTWTLINSDSKLILTNGTESDTSNVTSISSTTMVQTADFGETGDTTLTLTYTKQ